VHFPPLTAPPHVACPQFFSAVQLFPLQPKQDGALFVVSAAFAKLTFATKIPATSKTPRAIAAIIHVFILFPPFI
jgi:hypothetical protein